MTQFTRFLPQRTLKSLDTLNCGSLPFSFPFLSYDFYSFKRTFKCFCRLDMWILCVVLNLYLCLVLSASVIHRLTLSSNELVQNKTFDRKIGYRFLFL